ncbi:class I SAM-dependent methyltransferase [Salinigranum marinum]|uniref:class I SAM-dependent methyltransferase n=1 Tax=Salinigranum marinum TaxID=1515595 RepID=UPI002989F194|nr:methyltransferase domain-containing protein [Salinigranum marinum]
MRSVLSAAERTKFDERPDQTFYEQPRFVTHADDAFCARLTDLYGEVLEPGDRVLDAMSSWVSHLPDESYEVVGHGLNAEELAANDRLDEWFVQDLNADQDLSYPDAAFDAVCCALSVQYLEFPGRVFAEFRRVLAPDGVLVVSFSNRLFPTKAVRAWRAATMDERIALLDRYLDAAGGFERRTVIRERPGADPFYAVVAGGVAADSRLPTGAGHLDREGGGDGIDD